jgi:dephospho-CoA kinase
MNVYAMTGGIASGKSEASRQFEALGIPVVDADSVAHQVMEPGGRAFDAVVTHFGERILTDGRIDREKLGAIVFSDPEELQQLNALVHPATQVEIAQQIAALTGQSKNVIVEAALHAENGKLGDGMSGLILVHAPVDERIRRLGQFRGLSEDEARKRIAAQTPPEKKMHLAKWVIQNTGSMEDLHRQVEAVARELKGGAGTG